MNKIEFSKLQTKEDMIIAFNQLKDDYKQLFAINEDLQEENKFLKLNNPEANIEHFRIIKENKRKIDNLRKKIKTLQEENQTLKNQLDFIEEQNHIIDKLEKEIERLKANVKLLDDNRIYLNDKINKALNYIKNESWFCYKDNEEVIDRTPVEELIKILEGDNND